MVKTVVVLTIDETSDVTDDFLLRPAVGGALDPEGEDEVVVVAAVDNVGGGGEDLEEGAVIDKSVGSAI